MTHPTRFILLSLAALTLAGCSATPSARQTFQNVQSLVQDRTGRQIQWNQDSDADRAVSAAIDHLLARPLSCADAVQIALLGNPNLQAQYESLGIAQADLVQAGLLSNPSFNFSAQFAVNHGKTRLDGGVSQDIIGLLFVPLRKKIAATQLRQTELHVAAAVLQSARDVETAYYTAAASQQKLALHRQLLQATDATLSLARRQHQTGTITDLRLALDESRQQQTRADLARLELTARTDLENLNRIMGLATPPSRWSLQPLPSPPSAAETPGSLESLALAHRLDLLAARVDVETAQSALHLGKHNIITDLSPGISFERDTDGAFTLGPSISAEIPLFDHGQARVPRLQAFLRQARRRLQSLESLARSDVRLAADRMSAARDLANLYHDTLIPQQSRINHLTMLHYNAMQATMDDLLDARAGELSAREQYVEAVRDYCIARADLTYAVGGRLPPSLAATRPTTQPIEHRSHIP